MATVDIETLKENLGDYVRLAASGETVVVTDSGQTVAEIVPPRAGVPSGEDRPLSAFEVRGMREGWLTPARIRGGSPPPSKPVEGLTFEQLMTDLDRDREIEFDLPRQFRRARSSVSRISAPG